MPSSIQGLVNSHPIFDGISLDVRTRFSELAVEKHFQTDEILTFAGDCWPYLFLVADGNITVMKASHEGRSLIVAQLGQGDLFWGLSFFEDNLPNPVTLQFAGPSTVYLWSRDRVLSLLQNNGLLTWKLALLMVKRMVHASEVIDGLAFQPVAGRLACLLLDNFDNAGEQAIKRSLTLDEMAARVGTTREMVCRALYRFSDQNLIEVTRTEFVLTDKGGLARLAERE